LVEPSQSSKTDQIHHHRLASRATPMKTTDPMGNPMTDSGDEQRSWIELCEEAAAAAAD
jgi:hypothetical protein